MTISVVQQGAIIGGANPTVTLGAAPTPGNILIALGSHYNNNPTPQNGYTAIYIDNGSNDGTMAAYKVADGSDMAAQTPYATGGGGQSLAVVEVAGTTATPIIVDHFVDNTTTILTLNSPAEDASGFLFGVFCQNQNSDDFTVTGATIIGNATGTTSDNSPRRIKSFSVASTGSAQSITATLDAGHSSTGTMVYLGFIAPPSPGVYDSRMSEYLVEGPSPGLFDSRMSEYLVEGSNSSVFVSRMSQYLVIGPPTVVRRRAGMLIG